MHLGIPRMASQVSPSTPPTSPTTEDRGPTPTSRHGTPGRLAYAIMALVVAAFSSWWFGTFFIFPYIGINHPN